MRWLAPEVIQTSAMDCGPAALKCVLEGLGIPVGYGRLREACQTDVDGTSIDTIEDVARALGLDAEQHLVPADHLLMPQSESLPAIAVLTMPSGLNHFVVLYRRLGPLVQVMDPERGRHWVRASTLRTQLLSHPAEVPVEAFREYADTAPMLRPLERRLERLGVAATSCREMIAEARRDPGWRSIAALDAATRSVTALVSARAIRRGRDAERLVRTVARRAIEDPETIPTRFWSVGELPPVDDEPQLWMRGAVAICIRTTRSSERAAGSSEVEAEAEVVERPEDLVRALQEPPLAPLREALRLLRADGMLAPLALLGVLVLAALGSIAEVMLLRGLLDLGGHLQSPEQRVVAVVAMVGLLVALALLEWPRGMLVESLGRRLELRVRVALQTKVPRLPDRYFRSRLISDMAQRSHSLALVPQLPRMLVGLVGSCFGLAAVVGGLVWMDPSSAAIAIGAALLSVVVPLVFLPLLSERDFRVRTHLGALASAYLDGLLGITAVRAHAAERATRREHETLLVEWQRAARALLTASVGIEAVMALFGFGLAAGLVGSYLMDGGGLAGTLLVAYWALSIPTQGERVAAAARSYPQVRSVFMRILEVLGAPEEPVPEALDEPGEASSSSPRGVSIRLLGVEVHGGGNIILQDVELEVEAGRHVAIVGSSGAGKSSLLSVLLGFHHPSRGRVEIDGVPLEPRSLAALRARIAWIDPTVQLWNRSLLANLRYGSDRGAAGPGEVLRDAQLLSVLERLPEGLGTTLGEGGAMLSGGEGQRVRAGRAFLRSGAGLALLDEPFRGLDRDARRSLMASARRIFAEATLIAVTHDVRDTDAFERVVVIEGGRIVEDGAPAELLARPGSRYAMLHGRDVALAERLWSHPLFRRVRVEAGRLTEIPATGASDVGS
ncbi:MAG: ATP-binding cassette domain-containing protein [Myxococcales bacterium]|nr:ATP-binding cassette domain-containing protein [Myxococcales bacterium]MCB9717494.1 ATP-binding cassette domain-containing protein [Myxococcales bacterium]